MRPQHRHHGIDAVRRGEKPEELGPPRQELLHQGIEAIGLHPPHDIGDRQAEIVRRLFQRLIQDLAPRGEQEIALATLVQHGKAWHHAGFHRERPAARVRRRHGWSGS